jgi:acetyl esterase/lipase
MLRGWLKTWLIFAAVALGNLPVGGIAAATSYEIVRDRVYAQPAGTPLHADICCPHGAGPFPAVLCIHGGAWLSGNKFHMATIGKLLAERGYTVVSINYRLAPQHKSPAQIDDCRQALHWMRKNAQEYKIDPDRLAAWGYSAGGHLAALLGVTETDLKAVVAGGAPCDFCNLPLDSRWFAFWLGGSRRELPEVYYAASPAAFVSAGAPPFFFYHGESDSLVPLASPKEMAELLKRAKVPVTMYVVPGGGHIAAFFNKEAMNEAIKFLDTYVKKVDIVKPYAANP